MFLMDTFSVSWISALGFPVDCANVPNSPRKPFPIGRTWLLFLFALKRKMYAFSLENKQFGEYNNNSYNEWSAGNS